MHVDGDISSSGTIIGKTYKSEEVFCHSGAVGTGTYYFTIGATNDADDSLNEVSTTPAVNLIQTAMCDTKIKRIKLNFHNTCDDLMLMQFKLRKWNGSGTITTDGNWGDVGTAWSPSTGADISANDRLYHAPSDWTLSAGEIYGLVVYQIVSTGTNIITFTGGIVLEEDWDEIINS